MKRLLRGSLVVLPLPLPLLLLLPAVSFAPVGLGPWAEVPFEDRASFTALASTPAVPGRLYASGSSGGVWRSDDAADHWTYAGSGLPHDAPFGGLAASPHDGDVAYTWSNTLRMLFRTTDGGGAWTEGAMPGSANVTALLGDADDAASLWACTANGSDRGLWRSTDTGTTWAGPVIAGTSFWALARHPSGAGWLLAGTDAGIQRSTDGGATWTSVFAGASVRELDWCLPDPAQVWGRPIGLPLLKSTDEGGTWACQGTGATSAIAVSPTDPATLFADGLLYGCGWYGWGYQGYLNRSTDGGSTWSRVLSGPCNENSGWTPMCFLEVDPDAPLRVHAVWTGQGLDRSDTGGGPSSFARRVAGVHHTGAPIVRVGAGDRWYVRSDRLAGNSSDGGVTWSVSSGCMGPGWLLALDASAGVEGLLHESGVPYPPPSCGTLASYAMRSTDAGQSWRDSFGPWGFRASMGLVVSSPLDGETIYGWDCGCPPVYGETPLTAELWRSDDGGMTAETILVTAMARDARVDPRDARRVLALGRGPDPLRETTDGGATWASASRGLPARGEGVRLRADPADPDHLLAAFAEHGVFESTDGAASWRPVPLALGAGPGPGLTTRRAERLVEVRDADWDVTGGGRRIFVLTTRGVFVEGFGYVPDGLYTDRGAGIAFSAGHGKLLLGTESLGLFALDVPPPGGADPDVAEGAASHPVTGSAAAGSDRGSVAPNPFSRTTTISFAVPRDGVRMRVDVLDVAGRRLRTLLEEKRGAGTASVVWDGRDASGRPVPPGVYFVRVETDGHARSQRLVRLR